jgi:alpha-D-ribose 1-methylphosphonate 5-phosphate C-P lyase
MAAPYILVVKPGTLDAPDIETLRDAGVIVLQVRNPKGIRFLQPEGEELSGGDLLVAAMRAIKSETFGQAVRVAFASNVAALIDERAAAKPPSP